MESNDLVSVVIPVYNSEKFLGETISSVLNQTYKNLEIIAVDDGSTDNSLKILEKYANKIIIVTQSNQGLSSALNLGIKKMSGKWLKWFSPDDILNPDAIEILVETAKTLQGNTIVYSNWDIIDENNQKLRSFSETDYNHLSNFEFNIRLLDGQQINVNTSLIPFSIIEKGCVIRELRYPAAIDYDFFLRAGILYDVNYHLISFSLVKYRIHANQLSHSNISKTLLYLSEIKNQILSQLDDSERTKYLKALEKFKKTKPLSKKTLEFGLRAVSDTLPEWVTDRLLVFYLNSIRRRR